jgi:hypothetical protein
VGASGSGWLLFVEGNRRSKDHAIGAVALSGELGDLLSDVGEQSSPTLHAFGMDEGADDFHVLFGYLNHGSPPEGCSGLVREEVNRVTYQKHVGSFDDYVLSLAVLKSFTLVHFVLHWLYSSLRNAEGIPLAPSKLIHFEVGAQVKVHTVEKRLRLRSRHFAVFVSKDRTLHGTTGFGEGVRLAVV